MKRTVCRLGVFCWVVLSPLFAEASPPDAYNVEWNAPSADHHGSMPLGNGDIALNAWASTNGDLQFYIGKTDAWDDNARLLKVGKVRIHLEPNPFAGGRPFRQTLSLRDATLKVDAGDGAGQTHVQAWVDASQPVIHVTVESATPVQATAFIEVWRTNQFELAEVQCSDVMNHPGQPQSKHAPTLIEPDTVLAGQRDRIGWFHRNIKSIGPQLLADIQGLAGFEQPDPLLHRTFGAMVTAVKGERLDDLRLRSPSGTSHRFSVFVLTRHPSTSQQWLDGMDDTIRGVESRDFAVRRQAHEQWWGDFWERSWIHASTDPKAAPASRSIVPTNAFALRLGMDQSGENRFAGELGRVSVYDKPFTDGEIAALWKQDRSLAASAQTSPLFSGTNLTPQALSNSASWKFAAGFTVEAWVKPEKLPGSGARIVDKITPGGGDGFLFDTCPGNSLRLICGQRMLEQKDALPAGQWTHVAAVADAAAGGCSLYVNGKLAASDAGAAVRDEAAYVSQMYHLQRFITACAGRGAYPIKFNGSLFTVPPGPTEADPDYRRWGPGYWWQNTRLPYLSLCASGDFDLMRPLFRMYADELLPLCKYRTKRYLGHEGAFYPECVMFWGAVFSETYGWTPFDQRKDKLQESGWHKWEWVGGLELSWMMLEYYEHTLDTNFLKQTALPFSREILTFFEQQYPTNAQGKLVMHPSQALETWWNCTNAMPELAGCIAVTERLLALPGEAASEADRELWRRLQAKLPRLPLRDVEGGKALAPAEFYAQKSNVENPELYAVFPFRLIAFNRPNPEWGARALANRWDQGDNGWRQDDLFMAFLGMADAARKNVAGRARSHDRNERFPAFWGPNYDWTPDQDHGGVLMKAFQSMLLQTDGKSIFLLPAWPKEWNVEFKLHAPGQTVVDCVVRDGALQSLSVTPESRMADIVIPKQFME